MPQESEEESELEVEFAAELAAFDADDAQVSGAPVALGCFWRCWRSWAVLLWWAC